MSLTLGIGNGNSVGSLEGTSEGIDVGSAVGRLEGRAVGGNSG